MVEVYDEILDGEFNVGELNEALERSETAYILIPAYQQNEYSDSEIYPREDRIKYLETWTDIEPDSSGAKALFSFLKAPYKGYNGLKQAFGADRDLEDIDSPSRYRELMEDHRGWEDFPAMASILGGSVFSSMMSANLDSVFLTSGILMGGVGLADRYDSHYDFKELQNECNDLYDEMIKETSDLNVKPR